MFAAATPQPEKFDSFFKWIKSDFYRLCAPAFGAAFLVVVDEDLRARYCADFLPPDPTPAPGVYVAVQETTGAIHVYGYGNAYETAVTEFQAAFTGHFEEDYCDEHHGTVEIISIRKPASVVAPAEAHVRVIGSATYDEVLGAGLAALHEGRASLFGYGVRVATGGQFKPGDMIVNMHVTVYAERD